jgi:hypothetical protein
MDKIAIADDGGSAFAQEMAKIVDQLHWAPLRAAVLAGEVRLSEVSGFLIAPERVIFHVGRTHIGIEYIGKERVEAVPSGILPPCQSVRYTDSDANFIDQIVGFDFSDAPLRLPFDPFTENLTQPTPRAAEPLLDLGWDPTNQDGIITLGMGNPEIPEGAFGRQINCRYFDHDETGLKTRHIKHIDFLPLTLTETDERLDFEIDLTALLFFVKYDFGHGYPLPPNKEIAKFEAINRFVEFFGDQENDEPAITRFLVKPENRFILASRFGAGRIWPEVLCEWKSGEDLAALKPDFMIVHSNGFGEIVEFKLPDLKGSIEVGKMNRKTFSSEFHSFIAQTREYRDYFDQTINRNWFKETYGFEMYKPKRTIIAGRRFDFEGVDWRRAAADHPDLTILNYDDLVDSAKAQLYL